MYALVKEGTVQNVFVLIPSCWQNITGFNNLSDVAIRPFGFLPIEQVPFDGNTLREISFSYEIQEKRVVRTSQTEPKPVVVPDITPRQIRLKLLSLGITEIIIDNTISALPSPDKEAAMISWRYSTVFERNHLFISVVGSMLGFTNEQLDAVWIEAAQL